MLVELYKTGRTVKHLSHEYDVVKVTIYEWISKYFNHQLLENVLNENLKKQYLNVLMTFIVIVIADTVLLSFIASLLK